MKSATMQKMERNLRQTVRNIAICVATMMGLVALYYCLLPALADTAGDGMMYVFFDNGLSKYTEYAENNLVTGAESDGRINATAYPSETDAESKTNGSAVTMQKLSDVKKNDAALWNAIKSQLGISGDSIKNVNPDNVYVSTTQVANGSYLVFDAYSDGIVYDTVSNYRINAASREWGYDYYDFHWISDAVKISPNNNCYYAPPQLMINRYAAFARTTDDDTAEKQLVQMIYAHGDDKDGASSKPEVEGSWVSPNNASGRTFYDAEFAMEGKLASVTAVNDLGKNSQSNLLTSEGSVALGGSGDNGLRLNGGGDVTVYHATATFFDYFSDWELAGNPLANHKLAYTYDNETAQDRLMFSMEAKGEPTVLTQGFAAGTTQVLTQTEGTADTVGDVQYKTTDENAEQGKDDYIADFNNGVSGESAAEELAKYGITLRAGAGTYDSGRAYGGCSVDFKGLQFNLSKATDSAASRVYSINFVAGLGSDDTKTLTIELYTVTGGTAVKKVLDTYDVSGVAKGSQEGWTTVTLTDIEVPSTADSAYVTMTIGGGTRLDNLQISYRDVTPGTPAVDYLTFASGSNQNANFFTNYDCSAQASIDTARGNHTAEDGTGDNTGTLQIENAGHPLVYRITDSDTTLSNLTKYNAAMWVYQYSGTAGSVNAVLKYTLNGTEAETAVSAYTVPERENWYLFNADFTLPSGASNIRLCYTVSTATWLFDDFGLTATPYTSTGAGTITFADDNHGFVSENGDALFISTNEKYDSHTDDGSHILLIDSAKGNAKYPIADAASNVIYTATTYAMYNGEKVANKPLEVFLQYKLNGTQETALLYTFHDPDGWLDWGDPLNVAFTVPQGATDVALLYRAKNGIYRFDDFTLTAQTITGGHNKQTGNASNKNPYNIEANVSGWSNFRPKLTVGVADGKQLDEYSYSNKELYYVAAEVMVSSGTQLQFTVKHYTESGGTPVATEQLAPVAITPNTWQTVKSPTYQVPIGATYSEITMSVVGDTSQPVYTKRMELRRGVFNAGDGTIQSGSYSEGTNRIAYAYQGMSFNEAISEYYKNAGVSQDTIPLYFGSNSWMTGNMRYYHYSDRNDQYLFTLDEIETALKYVGAESTLDRLDYISTKYEHDDSSLCADTDAHDEELIHADSSKSITGVGAYIIPLSRDYWRTLFGFEYDSYSDLLTKYQRVAQANGDALHDYLKGYAPNNTSLGFSNSRGVVGLVDYDSTQKLLMLDGTTLEAPYFNEEFIKGENDANAAYGEVYENVDFPFAYNEATGYYEFDSTRAYYAVRLTQNQKTKQYYMDYYNYKDLVLGFSETDMTLADDGDMKHQGVKKADTTFEDVNGSSQTVYQFYPFNSPAANDSYATENLMFGMKLDIPFNMPKDDKRMEESMFKFSGDDDVWVYVDGGLALDIGGTHTAVGGFLDLKHGYGVVGSSYSEFTGTWENASNLDNLTPAMDSGKDDGISNTQKRGFAALAALDTIDFEAATVEGLELNKATLWKTSTLTKVEFFDDKFTLTPDGNGNTFQYRIRRVAADTAPVSFVVDVYVPKQGNEDTASVTSFALNNFEMDQLEDGEEISDHELTIYYMERGLNSSNFKLEFNFIPSANRTIEKDWGDGAHDTNSPVDGVLVELYRAEPTNGAERNFNLLGTDYSLVRAIGHSAAVKAAADSVESVLIDDGANVNASFTYTAAGKDTFTTLALNGVPLSEEAYLQFKDRMGMIIRINGNEITANNGDTVNDAYEFANPKNDLDCDAFETFYSTNDSDIGTAFYNREAALQTGFASAAAKRTAIVVPQTTDTVTVTVEFKQSNVTPGGKSSYYNDTNTWGMYNNSAWLLEAYAVDISSKGYLPVASDVTTAGAVTEINEQVYDSINGTYAASLDANEMQIVITHAFNERWDSQNDTNQQVTVTYDGENCKLYLYNGELVCYKESDGKYYYYATKAEYDGDVNALNAQYGRSRQTTAIATAVMGASYLDLTCSEDPGNKAYSASYGSYKGAITSDPSYQSMTVDTNTAGRRYVRVDMDNLTDDSYAIIMRAYGNEDLTSNPSVGTYTQNSVLTGQSGYSLPALIGTGNVDMDGDDKPDKGKYLLEATEDPNTNWRASLVNLLDSEVVDGEEKKYHYLVREVAVRINKQWIDLADSDYVATFYDGYTGEPLEAQHLEVDNNGDKEVVTLYSLDTEVGTLTIRNDEVTDLELKKEWGDNVTDQSGVAVDIYAEDPANEGVITKVDAVAITEDGNWSATVTDLPVWNGNQSNPQKLKYYVLETTKGNFYAHYTVDGIGLSGVKKTLGDEEITVYPVSAGENNQLETVTITNQASAYQVEIEKVDGDDTSNLLDGATFILYEWVGDGDPPANPTIQDIMNDPDNWKLITKDDTSTPATTGNTAAVQTTKSTVKKVAVPLASRASLIKATSVDDVGTITYSTGAKDLVITVGTDYLGDDWFYIHSNNASPSGGGATLTTSDEDGSVSLSNGVKMESATRIEFNIGSPCKVTMYVTPRNACSGTFVATGQNTGSKFTSNQYSFTADDAGTYQVITMKLTTADTYSIAKSGDQCYVGYIKVEPYTSYDPTSGESIADALGDYPLGDAWYTSDEAKYLAECVLGYQVTPENYTWGSKSDNNLGYGGWRKFGKDKETGEMVPYTSGVWAYSTTDNEITTSQIRFMARMYKATGDTRYLESAKYGIDYLLGNQYANGGFPQCAIQAEIDGVDDYHIHVTYNDNAMVNLLKVLAEVRDGTGDFAGIGTSQQRTEAVTVVNNGIQCILDSQIIINGKYTAWCQQHDKDTLAPTWGRVFEPPSVCTSESVNLVKYLQQVIDDPNATFDKDMLKRRVNAALTWFKELPVLDIIVQYYDTDKGGCTSAGSTSCDCTRTQCRWAVTNPDKTGNPQWARFYSLADGSTPVWCDRSSDGKTSVFCASFNAMSCERRSGYSYTGNWLKSFINKALYSVGGDAITNLQVNPHGITAPDFVVSYGSADDKEHPIWYNNVIESSHQIGYKGDLGDYWHVAENLAEGSLVYGDADTRFSKLPGLLLGAEYLMPSASSYQTTGTAYGQFTTGKDTTLYVALQKGSTAPAWLSAWDATALTLKTDDDTEYQLYRRYVPSNTEITLGESAGNASYLVMALDGDDTVLKVPVGAAEFVTGANGETGKAIIPNLLAGKTYALIEITAPVGYTPVKTPTIFRVNAISDGASLQPDLDNIQRLLVDAEYVTLQKKSGSEAPTVFAQVINENPNITLPATGASPFTILLRGIAALLPVLAGAHFVRKRFVRPVE